MPHSAAYNVALKPAARMVRARGHARCTRMTDTPLLNTTIQSLPLVGRGKVRDNYAVGDDLLLMVATDRISASGRDWMVVFNSGVSVMRVHRAWPRARTIRARGSSRTL